MAGRKTLADERRRRKMITVLWVLGLSVGVILLIYKELTAILYILATLGVTALLLIVAASDLEQADSPTTHTSGAPDGKSAASAK
jgi:hypothetical protein